MSNEIDITNKPQLDRLAAEIRTIKEQTARVMMQSAVEIGKRLAEAKAAVGHGGWENWLKTNVDYSQRTASNLIAVFQEYGQGQKTLFGKEANPQALAKLTYTQAVELLGIKDHYERAEFIENNDMQAMSTRELQQAIKDRDAAIAERDNAQRNQQMESGKLQMAEKAKELSLEELKKAQAEKNKLAKELKEVQQDRAGLELDFLKAKKELASRPEVGEIVDDKRARELETSLAAAKGKIKALEIKLEQPMEAVAIIPQETQEELESLRKKVAELQSIQQPAPYTKELENKLSLKLRLCEWQTAFNAAKAVILAEEGEIRVAHIKVLKMAMDKTRQIVDQLE